MMPKHVKSAMWIFLFGMTTGGLMAISIKYPVTTAALEMAVAMCPVGEHGLEKIKVGLSGKIYHVKCRSGKQFDLK